VPEGLSDPGRHSRHADQRGTALDTRRITAVILAGGQGTRLRPLTNSRPKPVVPLLNIPFLAYQLTLLRRHGVRHVVLSCSYLVDEIRRAMGDGRQWDVTLEYAVETEPLGTAGGVRNAADLVSGLVVVLNGDILTDADLSGMLRFHSERGSRATIFLTRVEDTSPYGLVELAGDGRVRRFIEKPGPADRTTDTINAGIYVLDAALLERIPAGRVASMEREFFPGVLADAVPCFGWISDCYWIDIGSPAKYLQAHLDLLAGRVETDLAPGAGGGPAHAGGERRTIAGDAVLGARVRATPPVVIGAGCRLEDDSRVGPSTVLGQGCIVGVGAAVEGAVLWEGVSVGAGAVLRDCIVGAGVRVGPHARVGPGTVLEDGADVA
jgi:mannose-1-phosphate guanylyltransferase